MTPNASGLGAPRCSPREPSCGQTVPTDGVSSAYSVNQYDNHDVVSSKLQVPREQDTLKEHIVPTVNTHQDDRGLLSRLTIPLTTSLHVPQASSPCVQSARESIHCPSFMITPAGNHGFPQPRNVVVFGESGVGKSSLINMIVGENVAETSNGAIGCTFNYQCHQVVLDNCGLNLWDTVGLDEGTEGTVPAIEAEESLKAFLRQVARRSGIDLLLYCVRGTRVRQALLRNYNLFYAAICRKEAPVALVVTGLENYEGDMEAWWSDHEKDLAKHGMRFDAHACVTTMQSDHPAIQGRIKQSRDTLRSLVRANFRAGPWTAKDVSLISVSLPDVPTLAGAFPAMEKRAVPLIAICDTTELDGQTYLTPTFASQREPEYIDDRRYKCVHIDTKQLQNNDVLHCPERRPDLLVFYASADSRAESTWNLLKQFYVLYGGRTCPLIVVFKGLVGPEAASGKWRDLTSSYGEEVTATPTFYPEPDGPRELVERADEALTALIRDKCLIRSGEELTRFQKFYRHSKSLLSRHF